MITLKDLKEMEPHYIFAAGSTTDNADGINMANTGRALHWIAVRGGIYDWTIYCSFNPDLDYIKKSGDKVHNEKHIRKLVKCDDEAFGMYRH